MIMQAIETRYLGPTNSLPSRIKATAGAGSLTLSYEYGLNADQNHMAAAQALAAKFGWSDKWVQGGNAKGDGYAFVSIA